MAFVVSTQYGLVWFARAYSSAASTRRHGMIRGKVDAEPLFEVLRRASELARGFAGTELLRSVVSCVPALNINIEGLTSGPQRKLTLAGVVDGTDQVAVYSAE